MTTNCRACCLMLVAFTFGACDGVEPLAQESKTNGAKVEEVVVERLPLPQSLREVSGLTAGPDGVLYAIADELGQIYAIDFARGSVTAEGTLGQPATAADFEALTHGPTFGIFALTSKGVLYQQKPGQSPAYTKTKTGLAKRCEFEGMVAARSEPVLWLLCKKGLKKKYENRLTLFAWDYSQDKLLEDRTYSEKYKTLGLNKNLAPSGLAIDPKDDSFFIVAAKKKAYLVLSADGTLLRAGNLPDRQNHEQAEGVSIIGSSIYIADEGVSGPAQLSRYPSGF